MKKIILISLIPIIVLADLLLFNQIADLMRQKSDIAVLMGVIVLSGTILINYRLAVIIQKQFKKK